jgi:16S rRNA (cytosine967-C5)-methyltransferase
MKAKSPRELALKALNALDNRTRDPADYHLDHLFQTNPHLDDRDRAFISQLVYGVSRWRLKLDWVISQFTDFPLGDVDPVVLNILRVALLQVLFLDRVPDSAAVNEAVSQARLNSKPAYVISFVNGILRNICREKDRIHYPDPSRELLPYLSVFYSYPEWLVEKWVRELGNESAESLLASQNIPPCLNIRTNTLRVSRNKLLEHLAEEGVTGTPVPYAPEGILLKGFKGRVDVLKTFKKGLFQVQDQAAMITSHLIKPGPDDMVLDICAGLGGKSTHMAALMENRGKVVSVDINRERLVNLGRNAKRLGITNIYSVVVDASRPFSPIFRRKFDKVVVDAPCSGLGVISRHPEGKWNREEEDILRLSFLQKRIMNESARMIEDGGQLLFITCTISKEENEGVVKDFLNTNVDMSLENMKRDAPYWARDLIDQQGFFRTFPHIHHMDGFFAALFRKN